MSRTNLPLAVLALSLLAVGGAGAATRDATLTGASLAIDSPCARSVQVSPDPSLHGQVVVTAAAENQGELDLLLFDSGETARISTGKRRCWHEGPSEDDAPTLELTIRVPVSLPLSVGESGTGRYAIGPVGGRLNVDLSGAGQVRAEAALVTAIDLSGDGSIDIAHVQGDLRIDLSGHGSVSVTEASGPTLDVDLSGAGSVKVSRGTIGRVRLNDSGAGPIEVGAIVGSAEVDLSGVGAVRFAKVTGELTKNVSGMGSVTVGD
jgi:hypothetical protein